NLPYVKVIGPGPPISQASASMMTERLVGKDREDVHKEVASFKSMMVGEEEFPEHDDLAALKGVINYPARVKWGFLAWTALQNGLEKGRLIGRLPAGSFPGVFTPEEAEEFVREVRQRVH